MSIKLPDGTVIVEPSKTFIKKTGGTMTGPLVLSGNPTENLHAVPKQYLDSVIGNLETYSTVSSFVDGKITQAISWKRFTH